jgi:hypothetical protein
LPPNVALLGGNFFGVADDNPYWMNSVDKPNLITQLDGAGASWKAYLQALPYAGYRGMCYPSKCNGSPDIDPLYVSKHDAIQNYIPARTERDWSRQVPIEQLRDDLASGNIPRFGYVIPDECHDEHGDPPTAWIPGIHSIPRTSISWHSATPISAASSPRLPAPTSGREATMPSQWSTTKATTTPDVATPIRVAETWRRSSLPATDHVASKTPPPTTTTRC